MEQLDRAVALRLALAARILPGVNVSELVDILHEKVGMPLNDERLKAVTVTNLKTGIGSHDGEEDGEDISIGLENIKLAVRYLWGEEAEDADLPEIQTYKEGDLPNSIRVAVASNNGQVLNGHFGSCIRFLIYQVSSTEMRLIDIRSTVEADNAEDKNLFRTQLIKDSQVLFVQSIGGPAAAKVIRADIYPMKIADPVDIPEKLNELQQRFSSPPPWLAKALGMKAEIKIH